MATPSQPNRPNDRDAQDIRENTSNRPDQRVPRSDDARPSTVGDTANGKGSRTDLRKDEKEQNDNFDTERAS